jgi:hypothetical protein
MDVLPDPPWTRAAEPDTEVSVAAVPAHPAPSFSVVAGKSLELALVQHELANLEWLSGRIKARELKRDIDLAALKLAVARLYRNPDRRPSGRGLWTSPFYGASRRGW